MNKTGFKTFVFSFVLTLSVILGAGRAYFYTPETTKEQIQIPRKNIALFFSHSQHQAISSKVEPVQEAELETPDFKKKELEIAQSLPEQLKKQPVVSDIIAEQDTDVIPIVVEKKNNYPSLVARRESIPDVPLVYAGTEKDKQSIGGAQQEIVETKEEAVQTASLMEDEEPELLSKPMVIKATKQIIKIDNVKKYQEKQKQTQEQNIAVVETPADQQEAFSLQDHPVFSQKEEPDDNQVANLGGDIPLTSAEEQIVEEDTQEREWQTMAEKRQNENPWLVARGSKFVKNKKVLDEEFSSESAKQNAERLIPERATDVGKTAKVAVQDNLLIPIPQELLDEDDLVPDIEEDGTKKKSPVFKKQNKQEDKSFFDNITSVFSKENREKAIKKLKEKSGKLMKGGAKDDALKTEPHQQILPTEIRLSFQPNRAEISGQTLKWIRAFAKKAADENNVGLEIRIDGSHSFELQQKRLNLLYNILTINDVPYQKINTVFVDREPNSFVVRTVKIMNEKEQKKEDNGWERYYQKW